MIKKIFFVMLVACSTLVLAQSQSVTVQRMVDWEARTFTFYLTTPVDQGSLPVSKQRSEGLITRLKTSAIAGNLNDFPLDSWGPFQLDHARLANFTWNLETATAQAEKDYSVFSSDMRFVRVAFTLPFAALTKSIHINYRSALRPSLMPTSEPFDYSGIVIYAAEPLPVRDNEARKDYLQPALLPSIFSERGELLVSSSIVERKILEEMGTAGYSFSSKGEQWPVDRVGKNPFVIAASQVFGNGSVDAVIGNYDADRILASEEGRKLLEQGKVLIIIKDPKINTSLNKILNKESDAIIGDSLSNQHS